MKLFRRTPLFAIPLSLAAFCSSLAAQAPAEATLYTRIEDGFVRAAIEIEIEPGWHLYHNDLGHPRAIGQKTTVELSGEGIEWGEVRFPEPHTFDQSDIEPGVFILGHEDLLTLYASGTLAAGATGKDIEANIRGLVCEVSCIPYRETVSSSGAGDDALFADFPSDLLPGGVAEKEIAAATPETQRPTGDVHEGGRADSTLYTRVKDGWVLAALEVSIDFGFHLYHTDKGNPDGIGKETKLVLHGEGIDWKEPIWPEPHPLDQSDIEEGLWINGHEGDIVVYVRGALKPGATGEDAWMEIHGQTCDDESCIDYDEQVVSQGAGPDKLFATFPGEASGGDAGSADGEEEDEGLLQFLLLAVFWGFFTLLMPCTYPMIPITISFFTKQAEARGGKVLPLSLTYGLGIVLIFILIGALFGSVIIQFATHWITNLVIGVLFLYFAFVLFGVINMQPPKFMMSAAGKAQRTGGLLGVFLMGATLVVTSFTCTAPFVGSLLSVGAAGGGGLGKVVLGMGVFGTTMAIPFVLLSLLPGRIRAMPKSGEWMNTLKFFLGFVEVAAAFKFLSNVDLALGWNLLSREVFLVLWGVIFAVAALFLMGFIFKSYAGTRTPKKMAAGILTMAFAAYCLQAVGGREMDSIMTAVVPPYSMGGQGVHDDGSWIIVENDYDAARKQARAEGKKLLLNFTGYL